MILYPSPILRQRSEPIKLVNNKIPVEYLLEYYRTDVVDQMHKSIETHNAVGIAAIQLGYPCRIIVLNTLIFPMTTMYNPVILSFHGEIQSGYEECLSIPNVVVDVPRFTEIEFEYISEDGIMHHRRVVGTSAIVIQHEIDHLNGKLIIDYKTGYLEYANTM
jgi:peptide deformylase